MQPVEKAIRDQCEYYFSDANILRDRFLREKMAEREDTLVPLAVILTFARMKQLEATEELTAKALADSTVVTTVTIDNVVYLKRLLPPPRAYDVDARTIVIKPVPVPARTIEYLQEHCRRHGLTPVRVGLRPFC